jgi:hypothetical protein
MRESYGTRLPVAKDVGAQSLAGLRADDPDELADAVVGLNPGAIRAMSPRAAKRHLASRVDP